MQKDRFILTGSSHEICQDFGLYDSFINVHGEEVGYAIISDGCSSSPNTDIGSRVLVLSAQDVVRNIGESFPDADTLISNIMTTALSRLASLLDINYWRLLNDPDVYNEEFSYLDATLTILLYMEDISYIFQYGDGCVLLYKDDNSKVFIEFESARATNGQPIPPYPIYFANCDKSYKRRLRYMAEVGSQPILRRTMYIINGDEITKSIENYSSYRLFNFPTPNVAMITTDGLQSFYVKGTNAPVDSLSVAQNVLNLKGLNGKFVQKRLKRMTREYVSAGIFNYDDITVAGISAGEDSNDQNNAVRTNNIELC